MTGERPWGRCGTFFRMFRKALALVVLLAAAAYTLMLALSPLEPMAWSAPGAASAQGPYAANQRLARVEWFAKDLGGPETVAFDGQGNLVTGLANGDVVRLSVDGGTSVLIAKTSGRPLGLQFDHFGNLIVCDGAGGLISIDAQGRREVLATEFEGRPFRLVDDLAIASDHTIYFSDASSRHTIDGFVDDLLEHQLTGRVLAYTPATRALRLVADGLSFANGVALSEDESFLVAAETGAYRLWRIELQGEKKGQKTILTDGLPGFPDNVRFSPSRKGFWVAIGSLRNPMVDSLAQWPTIRRAVGSFPKFLQPKPERRAYVLLVNAKGQPVESLQYESLYSYSPIASAVERDGYLYLSSFAREGLARIRLNDSGEALPARVPATAPK